MAGGRWGCYGVCIKDKGDDVKEKDKLGTLSGYCLDCGLMQTECDKECPKCEGTKLTNVSPPERWNSGKLGE